MKILFTDNKMIFEEYYTVLDIYEDFSPSFVANDLVAIKILN